ncbi:TfoX-like protein [Sulfitobacter noctilucicola]|uniref:DNA transformation protein n=1 Tax=Sulfitobacter noctilucicola TaxID=1342301 RepID=A0A7W6MB23_9RHOB|nr:TfoX/Sxy family protein [Sulfitobacter noctilucicola]KIN66380.1 TfoX-like protein [Sulfitobacter noctilucicola]MBB4175729.1 DNA transformation protein [Sulfitobacter noctilucicola]
MSLSASDIEFAKELFSTIPDVTTRRMFGGMGLYSSGVIFALMRSDGQILIKATDGPFAERLADMGAERWTYTRKSGTKSSMPYMTLPDATLDDPAMAGQLATEALADLA